MDDVFVGILREHARLRRAAAHLEEASESGSRAGLERAVRRFLARDAPRLDVHMRAEERDVFPLVERHLSRDGEATEALAGEHATLRMLLTFMRTALAGSDGEAAALLTTSARDLALLLRDHLRKEDEAVYPLVRRLAQEDRR